MACDQPANTRAAPRGWPFFLLGVLVFTLGPIVYAVQLGVLRQTPMPWHLLILAGVGVLLMALSLWRRFGVLRTIGFVVFLLLAGGEWLFFLVISKTPLYTGPAQVGAPLPVFETTLADGRTFGNRDLSGDEATIILFYRGHW